MSRWERSNTNTQRIYRDLWYTLHPRPALSLHPAHSLRAVLVQPRHPVDSVLWLVRPRSESEQQGADEGGRGSCERAGDC